MFLKFLDVFHRLVSLLGVSVSTFLLVWCWSLDFGTKYLERATAHGVLDFIHFCTHLICAESSGLNLCLSGQSIELSSISSIWQRELSSKLFMRCSPHILARKLSLFLSGLECSPFIHSIASASQSLEHMSLLLSLTISTPQFWQNSWYHESDFHEVFKLFGSKLCKKLYWLCHESCNGSHPWLSRMNLLLCSGKSFVILSTKMFYHQLSFHMLDKSTVCSNSSGL